MRSSNDSLDSLRDGACRGVLAWAIYGTVEYAFCSMLPLLQGDYIDTPWHRKWTAVILLGYVSVGLLIGSVAGLLTHWIEQPGPFVSPDTRHPRRDAAIGLTLIVPFFLVAILRIPLPPSLAHSFLLFTPVLGAALILATSADTWSRRLGFLSDPWVLSAILVIPGVLCRRLEVAERPSWEKLGIPVGVTALVLVTFLIIRGMGRRARLFQALSPLRHRCLSLLATVLILAPATALYGPSGHLPFFPLAQRRTARRPPVILIVTDTVRADHMSLYGYSKNTTPALRSFAQQATLYRHAVSASNMSLSSHASLFTGLYPSSHQANYDPPLFPLGRPYDLSVPTLAEILADAGYATAGITGNFGFLMPAFGLHRGFAYYDYCMPPSLLDSERYLRRLTRLAVSAFTSTTQLDKVGRSAGELNETVFHFLKKQQRLQTSFFLFINYIDVHAPYTPPPPYDTLFPGRKTNFFRSHYEVIRANVNRRSMPVPESDLRHLLSQYDGSIAYVDFELGRLFQKLRELRLFDESLIIITSDHGESFGRRNLIEHGVSVYQDQVHVPLIVKFPNQQSSLSSSFPASTVDVLPTVLDVIGVSAPDTVHGRSLLRLNSSDSRCVFSESFPSGALMGENSGFDRIQKAVVCGFMKLIVSSSGEREMYDLSTDPDEEHNRYRPGDKVAAELEARLADFVKLAPKNVTAPKPLNRQTLERLRSLGYLQ